MDLYKINAICACRCFYIGVWRWRNYTGNAYTIANAYKYVNATAYLNNQAYGHAHAY